VSLHVDPAVVVGLLDATFSSDDADYEPRLLQAVLTMTRARSGAFFRFQSDHDDRGRFRLRSVDDLFFIGPESLGPPDGPEIVRGSAVAETAFGRTQGSVGSTVTGLGPRLHKVPGWHELWGPSIVDTVGLVSVDARGDGVSLCAAIDHLGTLSPRESRLLARLATHVGARDRLRRIARGRRLDEAEVVISPEGKVLHATCPTPEAARLGLEARQLARRYRHDPEAALEVWQGLVDGRWSLVDHVDTDQRRYVLAIKNSPTTAPRANLTEEQRQVVALAATGLSDKAIAYTFGRPRTAISKVLERARRKLGARTRAELTAMWRRNGGGRDAR
jgi:DNA-binding CsgD family transcriptional regulator